MKVQINNNTLELTTGDITEEKADAIVNAANGSLLGGGGVDGAIHRAAGKELLDECKKVRQEELNGEHLGTGQAIITKGYDLPASYVIHTAGPVWKENAPNQEELLGNCYTNSLEIAKSYHLGTIAFPSISTGVYRFPIERATSAALNAIIKFLKDNNFGTVKMMLFSKSDYEQYAQGLNQLIKK